MVGYRWAASVVLVASLAGCVDDGGSTARVSAPAPEGGPPDGTLVLPDPSSAGGEAPAPLPIDRSFEIPTSGRQCQAGFAQRLVPFATAQASLPEGYRARDASGAVGAPAALDRALVAVEVHACAESIITDGPVRNARVSVYIEDPKIDVARPPVDHHWYELARYSDAAAFADRLAVAGYDVGLAEIQYDLLSVVNSLNHGVGTVDIDGTFELGIEAFATVSRREQTVLQRHWHATASGVVFEDMNVNTEVIRGVAACEARPGSEADVAAGAPSCTHPDTVGEVWNDTTWIATLTYVWAGDPGAPA